MTILSANNLKKYYSNSRNIIKAVDDVNIDIEKGEFVTIIGTSGSGKTTLLNLLSGLEIPTTGEVHIDGNSLNELKNDKLTIFRRKKIGFIFRSFNLIPILNVIENIILPVSLDNKDADEKYIKQIVQFLKIDDKLHEFPNTLSGGQQQRVAIARALSNKPAILVADEPTGNLDKNTRTEVISLLKKISNEFNQTIIMVTHDLQIAKSSDRIISIEDGKIVGDERL